MKIRVEVLLLVFVPLVLGGFVPYATGSVGTCWDPAECPGQATGDANCDGDVNLDDLTALKKSWGKSTSDTIGTGIGEYNCCADFNKIGVSKDVINIDDLTALKIGWSNSYPGSTNNETCGLPEPLLLVDNGVCNVSIHNIAAGAPSTVETYAAEELQAAFQLACGVTPEINPASPATIEIRLGVADQFAEGVGDSNEQAYAVRTTADGHIELLGNIKAAVMWAVDDFCKEVLNVSWPVSTNVMMLQGIPQSTVTVEQLNIVEAPDFAVRGWIIGVNTAAGYHYDDTIGKWMAHNRQNTVHTRVDQLAGGYNNISSRGIDIDGTMHDLAWLIPTSMFASHPEYFPLVNGVRVSGDMWVQRCIGNPDVCDIIIGKIEQGFIDYPDVKVFGVSQNDGDGGFCEDAYCTAMDGAQAGTGVYSNRYINFMNYLAEAIGPTHPGKYVGMFAYGETIQPPDIDISDNVSITFTYSGMGNYMRKLTDPNDSRNAEVMAYLNGWLDKSDNVHFWSHYWTSNMESCLTPYARTIVGAFSDLKALGFKGVCSETRPPYWQSQRLFFYALARASWDTSLDFNDILDDYCNEAYGPAAWDMKSFHLLYEDRIYEHVPVLVRDGAAAQLFPPAFSSADIDTLDGYLASAEAAGGSQANIDAVAEVNDIFERFKAISIDPATIIGIGPNLVTNPGAENGSAGWASDIFLGEGDYTFSVPVGGAHSGDKSFKIECTGATGLAARWFQTGIAVTSGKKYAVRFWVRASGGAHGENGLWMGSLYTPIGWVDSGDEWVRIVVPEIVATSSTISLYLTTSGPGIVYFDDIFIAELPD